MGRNERKWFLITGAQYLIGFAVMIYAAFHRDPDGLLRDWWAILFIGGCLLMAGGYISEFVLRFYNEKEGDRVYSKWGI
jgi:hypothetical protein